MYNLLSRRIKIIKRLVQVFVLIFSVSLVGLITSVTVFNLSKKNGVSAWTDGTFVTVNYLDYEDNSVALQTKGQGSYPNQYLDPSQFANSAVSAAPASITKDGYTYYKYDANCTYGYTNWPNNSGRTLHIEVNIYYRKGYIITFNPNGGSVNINGTAYTSSQSVYKWHGVSITLPSGNKPGYNLRWKYEWHDKTWHKNPGATYDTNASVTMVAQWSPITYTITYDVNGGTAGTGPSQQIKTHGVALTLSSTVPQHSDSSFAFAGWGTRKYSYGDIYQPGDTYTANESCTLYAQWNYKVTYDPGDASGSQIVKASHGDPNGDCWVTAIANPYTRDGYKFLYWQKGEEEINPGDSFKIFGAVTLYAVWEAEPKITYYRNRTSTDTTKDGPTVVTYNSSQTIATKSWTKSWTLSFNSNGVSATVPSSVSINVPRLKDGGKDVWYHNNNSSNKYKSGDPVTVTSDLNLYAQWVSSVTQSLSGYTASASGYTFMGWSTSSSGPIIGSVTLTGNKTLYAIWQVNPNITYYRNSSPSDTEYDGPIPVAYNSNYTIATKSWTKSWTLSFDSNGVSATVPSSVSINVPRLQEGGKDVWYHNNDSSKKYKSGDPVNVTSDLNLYAQWVSSVTQSLSGYTTSATGCTFMGWSTSETGSIVNSVTLTGDIKLYAIWSIKVEFVGSDTDLTGINTDIAYNGSITKTMAQSDKVYNTFTYTNIDGDAIAVVYSTDKQHYIVFKVYSYAEYYGSGINYAIWGLATSSLDITGPIVIVAEVHEKTYNIVPGN